MENTSDEVHVGGDFLEVSDAPSSDLTAGTMYIGGNFRQVNGSSYNFSTAGSVAQDYCAAHENCEFVEE